MPSQDLSHALDRLGIERLIGTSKVVRQRSGGGSFRNPSPHRFGRYVCSALVGEEPLSHPGLVGHSFVWFNEGAYSRSGALGVCPGPRYGQMLSLETIVP